MKRGVQAISNGSSASKAQVIGLPTVSLFFCGFPSRILASKLRSETQAYNDGFSANLIAAGVSNRFQGVATNIQTLSGRPRHKVCQDVHVCVQLFFNWKKVSCNTIEEYDLALLPPETVHAQGPKPNLHAFPFFHFKLLAEVPDKVGPSENAPFYYVLLLYRFTGHFCQKNLNPVFTNMRHTHAPGSVLTNVNPQLVPAISAPQMRACCFGRIAATFDHGSF